MRRLYFWGGGDEAEKLIKRNPLWLGFLDAIVEKKKLKFELPLCTRGGDKGVCVIHPDDVDWGDGSIFFVVSTRTYYDEVAAILRGHGREEARDFIGVDDAWRRCLVFALGLDLLRVQRFMACMRDYKKWIPNMNEIIPSNIEHFVSFVREGGNVDEALLSCCADEGRRTVALDGAVMEYENLHDFSIICRELLVREEDYFDCEGDEPFVIDGGANVGLAIYYFLHEHPGARIVAFEPNPKNFDVLRRNIERNKWDKVTAYPYALSGAEGELSFYTQECGLAGSLTKRNFENVDIGTISEIRVPAVRLSKYIDCPVDYLKLDIEGSETLVMEEIEDRLDMVSHVTIEFHDGPGKGHNFISSVTGILERHGFAVNIYGFAEMRRPMERVGHRVSEVIFARR